MTGRKQKPVVKPVKTVEDYSNSSVCFTFEDGYKAYFYPYSHGFGYQCEGLEAFMLRDDKDNVVCQYNGRLYRCGPQASEHKIVTLAEGYTQQQVAEYWRSARVHMDNTYFNAPEEKRNQDGASWWHWRLVGEGGFDLESFEKGTAQMLETTS